MLHVYNREATRVRRQDGIIDSSSLSRAIWIDMIEPSKEEETAIESVLGVEVPTPEEMREVESSSQVYREGDATFMTIRIMNISSSPSPRLTAATFILTPDHLITLRYGSPSPFRVFSERLAAQSELLDSPKSTMIGLLETIVGRVADILENVGDQLDKVSECLFTENSSISLKRPAPDLEVMLQSIGRSGDLASRVRESLHSIDRITPALVRKQDAPLPKELAERLSTLRRDVRSLLDHDAYLTSKIQFLLDSNLGLISIQQNAIIKFFSVAAVIFLPPTLVASIYGMNFEHIPELKWIYGYPFALALMVVSSVVPYWYFKRRRWL
jgi:magnesium transporter